MDTYGPVTRKKDLVEATLKEVVNDFKVGEKTVIVCKNEAEIHALRMVFARAIHRDDVKGSPGLFRYKARYYATPKGEEPCGIVVERVNLDSHRLKRFNPDTGEVTYMPHEFLDILSKKYYDFWSKELSLPLPGSGSSTPYMTPEEAAEELPRLMHSFWYE